MSTLRVRPFDVEAEGSYRERVKILRILNRIRKDEVDNIEGQLLLDELLATRLETVDGSDLEEALDKLSAAEANELVSHLLVSEVPTESAES